MKPPHPPPATFYPCSSLSPLLHFELHHHARFHLHTKSTATFHCPPPCLPPALSHLPSAHEKAEEQDGGAAVQKLARPLHSRTSHYFFSGSRWEPGEGWHLDKCPLEVFLLSPPCLLVVDCVGEESKSKPPRKKLNWVNCSCSDYEISRGLSGKTWGCNHTWFKRGSRA